MKKDPYTIAHLAVSAIRIREHQDGAPPSIEAVCKMLRVTLEQGHLICRQLVEKQIVDIVEGAFGTRLHILDHLKIEEIPKGEQETHLDKELRAFQSSRKHHSKSIESFKAKQVEKKKALFSEIEKKLKENLEKK
ncbi:MAG: hypothetical protein JRH15_19510 [Deltaproteobacteria bacterium]|nr:hypothetical protein [Deltaproteobacteria bacterium]